MNLPRSRSGAFGGRIGRGAVAKSKSVGADSPVEAFLAGVEDPSRRDDCRALIDLMRAATGCEPRMWFTPATEVERCGHATLASAHLRQGESEGAALCGASGRCGLVAGCLGR